LTGAASFLDPDKEEKGRRRGRRGGKKKEREIS